jgi:NAD(P)-dependent dehydrogenase (short-subunit alcohol dehydrogenase family)
MAESPDLSGKTVLITGATSGIGLQAAATLAKLGAFVIGVGRNSQRCLQAEASIQADFPKAQVHYLLADLSQMSQVRALAASVRSELNSKSIPALDVLINNAGVYSGRYIRTADGFELTMAVNHFAPFLLTHELLPLLTAATSGRIITVSSHAHTGAFLDLKRLNHPLIYFSLWAYKVSKLANVLFSLELDRRLRLAGTPARAFALDPGLVNTDMGEKAGDALSALVWKYRKRGGASPEVPVKTVVYLAGQACLPEAIYWRDCFPKTPSRQAQRADLARQLWELSSRLCAIDENIQAEK